MVRTVSSNMINSNMTILDMMVMIILMIKGKITISNTRRRNNITTTIKIN
jgi:hypothetical protein